MAARGFLLEQDYPEAWRRLLDGVDFKTSAAVGRARLSQFLAEKLLSRLATFGEFKSLEPVLLGSWARGELCPRSDIDLLLVGPESKTKEFLSSAMASGLKLRTRVPEDPADWTVGVEPFDVLALNFAVALNPQTAQRLIGQQAKVGSFKRSILKAIQVERKERRLRQDSITNFLEPNLKFGAGGLRDIEQALALRPLYLKVFSEADAYPFKVLGEIKERLLFLRAMLHLSGAGDTLSANDQLDMAKRLNMGSAQQLMTFVQSELERASFYADWVVAFVAASPQKRAKVTKPAKATKPTLAQVISQLKADPSWLRQFEVRRQSDDVFKGLSAEECGRLLHKALHGEVSDDFLIALHRTRLLEGFLPEFKKIRGLVQHDHYHRYTADAHLVQTLREVVRAETQPKRSLGALAPLARDLTPQDWWSLKLTALFHDLAKGGQHDHSTEGAKLVDQHFRRWGYSESLRSEVHWLVENHLILSTAAFRQNPQSQATWRRLFERGCEGKRLSLLALFTAIDIRSTNPEAWTEWKAKLLKTLVDNMTSRQAQSLQAHLSYLRKTKLKSFEPLLLQLDPLILDEIPPRVLASDLKLALGSELNPRVIRSRGRTWVRFHRRHDEPGIFHEYVKRLYAFGLNIQSASVHTLTDVGVYDWFCLRTDKPPRQIQKWLGLPFSSGKPAPQVTFQSIDLIQADQQEWILSFRGRDQRGLLLAALEELTKEKLSIQWARAHTWGQQIDDVFSVRPLGESAGLLQRLRERFVT